GRAGNLDIWFVEKNKSGWSEPKNIGSPINSEFIEVNPCLTRDGTLYFSSKRPGGFGSYDIYQSQFISGKYTEPENLGEPINSSDFESSPYVAPEGSYIIHNVFVGTKSETQSGLHIAFRREDGTWTQTKNMGEAINEKKPAMFAFVSYDGRHLFFTSDKVPYLPYSGKPLTYEEITQMFNSHQNGSGDIYWVDAKIMNQLRPEELK
ncbi:MAG: PD40 domain-containing protein, partial [Candidatus Aminicenantes bacterium]